MLALGDSGLGDVDADLTMGEGVEKFGKAASRINIHLMIIDCLFFRKIRKVGGHELVAEGALGEINHVDAVLVGCCIGTLLDDINDLAKSGLVGDGHKTVSPS